MVNLKPAGTRSGAGIANTLKLAGGIPLLLLALSAWAVALAGISVIRHEAGSDNTAQFGYIAFSWFVIFGSLFVLLAALIHVAGLGLSFAPIGHSGIAGLLAVFTTLTILETRDWNVYRKQTDTSTKIGKGVVTAFAGFLALSVFNALLILVLGNSTPSRAAQHSDVGYTGTQIHHNPAGAGVGAPVHGTTTTPATAV